MPPTGSPDGSEPEKILPDQNEFIYLNSYGIPARSKLVEYLAIPEENPPALGLLVHAGMLDFGDIFSAGQEKGMYRSLDSEKIIKTCHTLTSRVRERFPKSGLSKVAEALLAETQAAGSTALWLATPLMIVRVVAGVLIAFMVILFVAALFFMEGRAELFSSIADLVQGLDAAVNEIILFGAATYFLLNLENRLKRRRALKAIHTLRSMAHIIDMHQLTKDPDRLCGSGSDTPSSPERKMTPFELTRYLDYCSEMLAIISKISALYVQDFRDPVTLSAVDEVQDLTTGLADKIWQKIVILHRSTQTL